MRPKLLLIDDDADDRMIFCEALQGWHPPVTCIAEADPFWAIEMMKRHPGTLPDIIFMDINMPGKDGWHFLGVLKREPMLAQIPVIVYSTSSLTKDIVRAKTNGALFLFTKPDEFKDLQDCLDVILQHLEEGTLHKLGESTCRWFHTAVAR